MRVGRDAPCSGVGYRFLCFAGSEGVFLSLVFRFFSLCCCLCFVSPSFLAFLVLVISGAPWCTVVALVSLKGSGRRLDLGVVSLTLSRLFSDVFVAGRCLFLREACDRN